MFFFFFFFNDTATTEIYTLSLHDALPISAGRSRKYADRKCGRAGRAWCRTWTCRRSSDVRSSGTGQCLHGGGGWPWGRYNVPPDFLFVICPAPAPEPPPLFHTWAAGGLVR